MNPTLLAADVTVAAVAHVPLTRDGEPHASATLGTMKRAACIIVAVAVVGCGNKPSDTQHDGSGNHVASDDNKDEPKDSPPPPTVKPSGKGDCKTEYAPRPKRDPNPMCKVAGGTFVMTEPDYKQNPPSMTVTLSPYLIDQFEVTVAQVVHYLNATHEADGFHIGSAGEDRKNNAVFIHKLSDGSFKADPGTERFPVDNTRREAAMRYCAWAGKELPTEPQWEFAARHDPASGKNFLYPWGDEFDGKRARCGHDLCSDGPNNYEPVPVGTFDGTNGHADGSSPWGLYDMAGNAEEAVADCWYDYKPCNGGPCVDPPAHVKQQNQDDCGGISRGGAAVEGELQLRSTNRKFYDPDGFRCAKRSH